MATRTKKSKLSPSEKLDREYGKRMRKEEKRQKALGKKRLKEFMSIFGGREKTKTKYK